MKGKKREAVLSVILVTAIVVVLNILCSSNFYRADFTKDKIYTISDSTKKMLSNLKKPLDIKFYVSEEVPPRVLPIKRNVLDLLTEYERYGKGNVNVSILYPEKDSSIENDAKNIGIQKVQLNVIGDNKEELQSAYMGMALLYDDKNETIPIVMSINDLEFQMTSSILKLIKEKREKIVFLNTKPQIPDNIDPQYRAQLQAQLGEGHSIYSDTKIVGEALKDMYDVKEITLKDGDNIDEDASVLVINNAQSLTDWQQFAIDQFLMKGGKIVFIKAGMGVTSQMMAQPVKFNYSEMLEKYGLTLNPDMIYDANSYSVMIPQGNMRYLTPYPLWIKVSPSQMADELPDSFKSAGTLGFTYASSISVSAQEGITYKEIAKTSGKSWAETNVAFLDPSRITPPDENSFKVYDLSVMAEGKFKSAFTKDSLPDSIKDKVSDFIPQATKNGAVFLIGSSDFILDRGVKNFKSNGIFFINMADYLTNSTELVGIRNRGEGMSYIRNDLSDTVKSSIKWFGTLLIPFIVVLYGIIRMILRNRKSERR